MASTKPTEGTVTQINRKLAEKKAAEQGSREEQAEVEVTKLAEKPILVQGELPGQETEKDEEIIRAAEHYRTARDERMKLTKVEVERRDFLQAMMNSKGLKEYKFEGVEVEIVADEKVKVRIAKKEDEED